MLGGPSKFLGVRTPWPPVVAPMSRRRGERGRENQLGWGWPPSPRGVRAEYRPETHSGVFWRSQNAPFCTYMLFVKYCFVSNLGTGPRLGGNCPLSRRRRWIPQYCVIWLNWIRVETKVVSETIPTWSNNNTVGDSPEANVKRPFSW